jgi:protein-L-isoaspartate O-methyltransferase
MNGNTTATADEGSPDMTTAYDIQAYPSTVQAQTHPSRLGALAALCGIETAPFAQCRVLEIGGGDGINLIAMAVAAPHSQFLSFDLAEQPVARGQKIINELGLDNVRVEVMDICSMPQNIGTFDYVIAHGVYAWVPEPVRSALMELVGRVLRPRGIAHISYNALPGSHVRQALRDILLRDVGHVDDVVEKVQLARQRLTFYQDMWDETDSSTAALKREARRMLERADGVIFHDELGEVYAPQHVSDVIAAGAAAGLRYVCDAMPLLAVDGWIPGENFQKSLPLTGGDFERWEGVRDNVEAQLFRQSLFSKTDAPLVRGFKAERFRGLWVRGSFSHGEESSEGQVVQVFRTKRGGAMRTNSPTLTQALLTIAHAYPACVALEAWSDDDELAQALTQLWVSGVLEFTTAPLAGATQISNRPCASRLARHAVNSGQVQVPTLQHGQSELTDEAARQFLMLLDGTRTVDDIVSYMAERTGVPAAAARLNSEQGLKAFAEMGLLSS